MIEMNQIIFVSDTSAEWSASMGLSVDLTGKHRCHNRAHQIHCHLLDRGMGVRSARYALVIDDLKVTYVGVCPMNSYEKQSTYFSMFFQLEPAPGVTVSGADAILAKL